MIKKPDFYILVFALTLNFLSLDLFSEETVLNISLDFYDRDAVTKIENSNNDNFALIVEHPNSFKAILINEDFYLLDSLSVKKYDVGDNFMGAIYNDENFICFFSDKKFRKIYSAKYSLRKKNLEMNREFLSIKKENHLCYWNKNGILYLLTVDKGSSRLNLREINSSMNVEIFESDLGYTKYSDNSSFYNISDVRNHSGLFVIRGVQNNLPDIDQLTANMKVYPGDHEVFMTIEKQNEATKLITIKLEDHTFKVDNYYYPAFDMAYSSIKHTSIIEGGVLYQFNVSNNKLNLTLTDIETKNVLNSFTVDQKERIKFANSELSYHLDIKYKKKEKFDELETKELFKKFLVSSMGIYPYHERDKVFLALFGYLVIYDSLQSQWGIPDAPKVSITHFWTILNAETHKHIPGPLEPALIFEKFKYLDKIEKEKIATGKETSNPAFFIQKGHLYCCFMNADDHSLVIRLVA